MIRGKKAAQTETPTEPVVPQPLADRIVALGLARNAWALGCDGTLLVPRDMAVPAPFDLPSRLFDFPIEYRQATDKGGEALGLLHPELASHPFVQHVERQVGIQILPGGAPNDAGYSRCEIGGWWHACDLGCAGRWDDLLSSRQFTTDREIACAVGLSLRYRTSKSKGSDLNRWAEMRRVLHQVGAEQPRDPIALLRQFLPPSEYTYEGRRICPINITRTLHEQPGRESWGLLVGIEAAWFAYDRSGHLQWTASGRNVFEAGRHTHVEPSGQHAFQF